MAFDCSTCERHLPKIGSQAFGIRLRLSALRKAFFAVGGNSHDQAKTSTLFIL
jgi:hypothetical protein